MIGWTYCSGIGTPEIAAPCIDWRLQSEIDDFARAVLMHRFGARPVQTGVEPGRPVLWGDFAALRLRHIRRLGIPFPEILVAGTPCQAFSIAGLRGSLADARGNLTLEFVRHVHQLAGPGAARSLRWIVWENVRGVLSTNDNAFGCLLGGLVGSDDPLRPPDGKRWPVKVWLPGHGAGRHGGFSTLNISECPNAAVASTLSQVLETEEIPPRFYLSAKAARGLLRRADWRNKPALPHLLVRALRAVAGL